MSIIRLYHQNSIVENSSSLLSKEHTHYITNVMRLKRGSNISFFNKDGEWLSEIIFLNKERVEVKFLKKVKEPIEKNNIELGICLVKKNSLELILQKATELGVNKIFPIVSERTEIKDLNYQRANKIVIEATEQSNQMLPPSIEKIVKLENFIQSFDEKKQLLFANINSKNILKSSDLSKNKTFCILIGPEGDFSPKEAGIILSKPNVVSFSLSKNILRSDTAVITAISLVNFISNNH